MTIDSTVGRTTVTDEAVATLGTTADPRLRELLTGFALVLERAK